MVQLIMMLKIEVRIEYFSFGVWIVPLMLVQRFQTVASFCFAMKDRLNVSLWQYSIARLVKVVLLLRDVNKLNQLATVLYSTHFNLKS